jgi:hypothetical protein
VQFKITLVFGRAPGIGHMPHTGTDLARCSWLRDKPLGPLRPLASLGRPTQSEAGSPSHASPTLGPLGPMSARVGQWRPKGARGRAPAVPRRRDWLTEVALYANKPTRRTRSACSARATSGHATAPPSPAMKSRRHSITSSARARSIGARSRPRAFAVLRFIDSSNLAGAWTGRSAGFAPLRMRSM